MASEGLHEDASALDPATMDRHRAITSLMEELEAIDWYDQRIDAATDGELMAILRHNRDEEAEHAAFLLEWLRRRYPALDGHLREVLFTDEPLDSFVKAKGDGASAFGDISLGIGALRDKEAL